VIPVRSKERNAWQAGDQSSCPKDRNDQESRERAAKNHLPASAFAIGAAFIVCSVSPDFRQLLLNPGHQLPYIPYDNFGTFGALFVMQVAYWYHLRRLPIPFKGPDLLLSHFLLFLGRLSFVFGGALFSVVFFRHLPALEHDADVLLMSQRGLLLGGRSVCPVLLLH